MKTQNKSLPTLKLLFQPCDPTMQTYLRVRLLEELMETFHNKLLSSYHPQP